MDIQRDSGATPATQQPESQATAELAELSYEAAVGELERIVAQLERGSLGLDQALAAFQRGTALARHCRQKLDEVERTIRLLVENEQGEIERQPLDEGTL